MTDPWEMTLSFSTHVHLASWLVKYGGEQKDFYAGYDEQDPNCDLGEHHPNDILWEGPLLVYFHYPFNEPLLLNVDYLRPPSIGNFVTLVARLYSNLYRDNDKRIQAHAFADLVLGGFRRDRNSIWGVNITAQSLTSNGLKWVSVYRGTHPDVLNFIPDLLNIEDTRSAAQQIASHLSWFPFNGFEILPNGSLHELGQPPLRALWRTKLRDEEIILYERSWLKITQPDGTYEISHISLGYFVQSDGVWTYKRQPPIKPKL